ncbi:hypothetical protein DI09_44p70 [Mitosporidium daphniae]|uniref:Uncharacterized protein n=1 Tax=Mitosporidium daphniae TaxID=1485682 RepID=A0A098VPZ8_9MICR|nr:uncharacterized protein DI09_44p70 [Mitosporidium daphniae]KGG51103.1 hypothetical protein DI09_44p70 [Mitosporidium daphniae]|eukprot:XP_013237552.1 uncharacterized protein DI09_44p70 [Mitosporidium daphniae]
MKILLFVFLFLLLAALGFCFFEESVLEDSSFPSLFATEGDYDGDESENYDDDGDGGDDDEYSLTLQVSSINPLSEPEGSSDAVIAANRDSFGTLLSLLKSQVSNSDPNAKYKFGRVIGKGSKGVVMEATNRFAGQKVAFTGDFISLFLLFSSSNPIGPTAGGRRDTSHGPSTFGL